MKKILLLLICFSFLHHLHSQQVRVSIKIILDSSGNRPSQILTNEKFDSAFHWINDRMHEYNRGIEFVPFEYVEVGGPSNPTISSSYNGANIPINASLITSLEADAEASPGAYAWRSDMINVYFSRNAESNGICSFPTNGNHDEGIIIDHRRADEPEVLLHEIGHFFNLKHTADEACGTLANDDASWDQDAIAQSNYSLDYNQLTAQQQVQVDRTFNNVMSQVRINGGVGLGESRVIMTECQLDKWHKILQTWSTRQDVNSGIAWYVDDDDPDPCDILPAGSPCGCNGRPDVPYENGFCAFDILDGVTKDVIVFKPGTYEADELSNGPIVLDKPVLLTATRQGNAVITP